MALFCADNPYSDEPLSNYLKGVGAFDFTLCYVQKKPVSLIDMM